MIHYFTPVRKTATVLFVALTACYLVLTPGTTVGHGYIEEEIIAGNRMLTNVSAWFSGQAVTEMVWSRHGPVPLLFDLPFLIAGKVLVSQDFMLSHEPILLTAGMMTLVFLWLRKIATPWISLMLTLTGAFATMLWPYAYIGLEVKQSFFVLLVAYIALANGKIRHWRGILLFGIAGGLSLTVKLTGIVMWPAIAWLVYVQFRDDWRTRRMHFLIACLLIAGVWGLGAVLRIPFWAANGGELDSIRNWMADSPFRVVTNFIGIFGSPVKGLVLFAPVLVLCLYAVPLAFRSRQRDLTVFALLITACTAGMISLLFVPSDEVWGPRYMHVTIAPLLLCIGAAWPRFHWKTGLPVAGLAIAGSVVSFLGPFSNYGVPILAMRDAAQNTMEWINGDPVWGGPAFESLLVRTWLKPGQDPIMWVPSHLWVWEPPKDFTAEWRAIDLRNYSTPQSILLQYWSVKPTGETKIIYRLSLFSAIAGPLLLLVVVFRTLQEWRGDVP